MKRTEEGERIFAGRRDFLKVAALSGGALALGEWGNIPLGFAKDIYPASKMKITCVVAHQPGGGYDLISRGLAPYLTKYLREFTPDAGNVVIRNEPRASGYAAYKMIYDAKPDGYVFGTFEPDFVIETLTSKLDFDLSRYTFLLKFNKSTRFLVTSKKGFADWDEMIKFSKTKELRWGIGQFGRAKHIDSIVVRETLGVSARFIPSRSTAETISSLMRGDIHVSLLSEDALTGILEAGEIRVLADITGKGGSGYTTSKDLGHPDLADKVGGNRFYIAPPNLPKSVRGTLTTAFKKALNDEGFQAWAKTNNTPVEPLYGDDADKLARSLFNYYQGELKQLVLKYIKGD
jgi:tripartite-type tricarboxylate transporter receptor subunit TctC